MSIEKKPPYILDFASSQFAFWNSKIVEKRQKTNKTYEK